MRGFSVFAYLSSPAGAFAMVLASVLGVVIVGDAVVRSERHIDGTGGVATATASRQVLQDSSDWLSEAYWARKRNKRLNQRRQLGYLSPESNPFSASQGDDRARSRQSLRDRGVYRTVCVRLCDGYYFPISFSTTRDRFGRDEQVCQSRCAADTRLFYHPSGEPDAEELKDRRGNPYSDLANAFVYRTEYRPSCQCRAQPWTDEARQRHATYATEAWQKQAARIASRDEMRRGKNGDSRKAWRIVRPGSEADQVGEIETASVPDEGALDAGGQPFGVNVITPNRAGRMGLGRAQGSRPPRARVVKRRRDRGWRRRVFDNVEN